MLIVFSGLPGSGKSTLASAVANATRTAHVSVDPIEVAMWKAGIDRESTGVAAYEVARAVADEQLRVSFDVIVDAVNAVEIARQMWVDLAAERSTEIAFIECVMTDEGLHRRRLEARQRPEGYPIPTWDDVVNRRETTDPWAQERLVIDSGNTLDANVREVLQYAATFAATSVSAD